MPTAYPASIAEDRPQRAHGVQLHGEIPATGYVERQWLVQHHERFLQVSELPYRVLEIIDGQHTIEEIAAALTTMTDWTVRLDDVRQLLDRKLVGLVAGAGRPLPVSGRGQPNAPLRLSLRMKLLPLRLVHRLTDFFQYFYAPWVMALMAVLIVISHTWLYVDHGVVRSVEAMLYQPGGMLAVVTLGIVAGLFHEIGHASALKYGGGQPRGIGVGLYLFYPAFYSDVTDAYRLGRAARVRTDLGGIYFHLIFAATLISIAAFTGTSFLLSAALLFNIEALRQFIPFVRLDGYWLLADLTGIPDLFSQALPFVRRLWPHRLEGEKMPALKPWVRNLFATYLIITIPVLVFAFVMMLRHLPELLEHTWRALTFHAGVIRGAVPLTTRLLSATQMILLSVPLAATAYFLYSLVFTGLSAVAHRRVSGRAIRLAVAPVCTAILLCAVTAVGWTRSADTRAADLLAESRTAVAAVRTLEADVHGSISGEAFSGHLVLSRPNRARVEITGGDAVGAISVIADGETVTVNFPQSAQYTETPVAADGRNINAFLVDQVRMFFVPDRLVTRATDEQMRYVGRERLGTDWVDVVEIVPAKAQSMTWRYFVSDDRLVRRVVATSADRTGHTSIRWVELDNVRTNHKVAEEAFHWVRTGKRLGLGDLGLDLTAGRRAE